MSYIEFLPRRGWG